MRTIGMDTETTSTAPGARILELAAVAVTDDPPSADTLCHGDCNPLIPIANMDALAINGYTQARADAGSVTAAVLADLISCVDFDLGLFDGSVIAIHNAPFDCGMLAYEAEIAGITIPDWPVVCTLELARSLALTPKNGLDFLCEHYKLERPGGAHRAYGDAWATATYLQLMVERQGITPQVRPFSYWAAQWDGRYTRTFPPGFEDFPDLVTHGGRFSFDYQDGKGKPTTRTITPQGWAMQAGVLHFHGWCHLREASRTFRADRVVAVQSSML